MSFNSEHVENSLAKIRVMFEEASAKIEALKAGEKIPATELARIVAQDHNMTGPQFYPCLLFLIEDYKKDSEIEVKKGAKGGVGKRMPKPTITSCDASIIETKSEEKL